MGAVWMAARSQLRRRRGTSVVLVLLIALGGGVAVAAVAGASRTSSSMDRFVAYSRPEDGVVTVNGAQGDPSDPAVLAEGLATRARVAALPQVAEVARAPYVFLAGDRQGRDVGSVNAFAAADDRAFRTMDRPLLLDGRLARLDRPDEAVVDDLTAAQRHLRVGDRFQVWSFSAEQNNGDTTAFSKYPAPEGPSYVLRVVGVVRLPTGVNPPPADVVRDAPYLGQGTVVLTPAFLHRFARDQGVTEEALPGMEIFRVRLRGGAAAMPAFARAVAAVVSPGDGQVRTGSDIDDAAARAHGAIRLEAVALALFAGTAVVAALLLLGPVLARQVTADAGDHPTLSALGLGRRQRVAVPLVRAAMVAVAGGAGAGMVAVALSPLFPFGPARRAEIHPGVAVNVAVLALGMGAVGALVMGCALLASWRAAAMPGRATTQVRERAGWLQAAAARFRLGPAAVAGTALASAPGRSLGLFPSAVAGGLVGVTGIVGAATFGLSLRHLTRSPRQQGWNWDVFVGNPNAQALAGDPSADPLHARMTGLLAANPVVDAFAGVSLADGTVVDGRPVPIGGIEHVKGSLTTAMVRGRAPRAPGEIALGGDTLAALGKRVGQRVTVAAGDRRATMRIVGQALLPTAGNLSSRLSQGGVTTLAGLRQVLPDTPVFQFAVRYRPGADRGAAFASLRRDFGREVLRPYPGGEVGDLARAGFLPTAMAGLLLVLGVGALGLTLVGSVRRRRRDLAVLKTVGFVRRQVSATVVWQATLVAAGAVVAGVPAGIAAGRWTWRLVAASVGSVSPPVVPVAAVIAVVPAALVAANLVAGGPAWAAGRVRPADALRAE